MKMQHAPQLSEWLWEYCESRSIYSCIKDHGTLRMSTATSCHGILAMTGCSGTGGVASALVR